MSLLSRFSQILMVNCIIGSFTCSDVVYGSADAPPVGGAVVLGGIKLCPINAAGDDEEEPVVSLTGSFADMGGSPTRAGVTSRGKFSRQSSEVIGADDVVPVGGAVGVLKRSRSFGRLTPVDFRAAPVLGDDSTLDRLMKLGGIYQHPRPNEVSAAKRLLKLGISIDDSNMDAAIQLKRIGLENFDEQHIKAAALLKNMGLPQFRLSELSSVYVGMEVFDDDFAPEYANAMMDCYPNSAIDELLDAWRQEPAMLEETRKSFYSFREDHRNERINMVRANTIQERVLTLVTLRRMVAPSESGPFIDAATWYFVAYGTRDFSLKNLNAIQRFLRMPPSRAGFGVDIVKRAVECSREITR